MKKNILAILLIFVLIAIGFYLQRHSTSGPAAVGLSGDTVKIGAILILSNSYAAPNGEDQQRALNLAIEETNAQGGIDGKPVEVNYQDQNGDSPQWAVSALRALQSQGISLIIGPTFAPAASALAPIADKEKIVLISGSNGSEKFAPASEYTFLTRMADQQMSYDLAEYLYKKGFRKIAILGSQQEWEKSQADFVAERFEKLGGTVAIKELPLTSNLDLRDEALKIKEANPETLVFTNYGEVMVAAQRMRTFGIKVPFYSVALGSERVEEANGTLEGTIYISSESPQSAFTEKFEKRYGTKPFTGSDAVYDAANILVAAIKKASSTDPERVKNELMNIKTWDGASGKLTFDQYGGAIKDPRFYVVKGGEILPYTP